MRGLAVPEVWPYRRFGRTGGLAVPEFMWKRLMYITMDKVDAPQKKKRVVKISRK
jgi:hypothetical protein